MAKINKTKVVASHGDDGGHVAYMSPRGIGEDYWRPEDATWVLDTPINQVWGVEDARAIKKLMNKIIKAAEEK